VAKDPWSGTVRVIYPVPEPLPDARARFIQIVNTCRALAEKGTEVVLVTGLRKGYDEKGVLEFYGIEHHPLLEFVCLPMLRGEKGSHFRLSWHGVFHLSLFFYLFKKELQKKETVLFVRHLKTAESLIRISKLVRMPLVFEVHEVEKSSNGGKERKGRKAVLMRSEDMVFRKADALIAISESLRDHLMRAGLEGKTIHVIRDGVKKAWLGVRRADFGGFICYTGSLYEWKGIDTLILAMKDLPDERLVVVGGGGRLEAMKGLAVREGVAGRIEFVGPVSHSTVPAILSRAKVAVLPNISEGPSAFSSPLKLFEYMACGLPIVASDLPSFREILDDGRNALLFSPGDPGELADKIKELSRDPTLAGMLAAACKEDARQFTYEERALKIADVIEHLQISGH
jgi:glycosyltransferase involved in cell wall biosynthesis